MKNIGVWMDKEKAYVITLSDETEKLVTVFSEIDSFHIGGGSGSRFKGGPQDVVQDSKYLEREKHSFKSYFKEISQHLKNADSIVIFGPAEAGEKFNKRLQKKYKQISKKVRAILKADSMTINQTKALVRDFYKKELA